MRNYEVSFRVYDPDLIHEPFGGFRMKTKVVRIAATSWKSAGDCARARLPHSQFNAACTGIREI